MVRILAAILACALAFCPGAAHNAAAPAAGSVNLAGKVELVEGDVTLYDRAQASRRVRVGEPLFEGDGIVTGRDGELHVAMDDGGYLAVRPNTRMSVIAYQAQGREDDRSIFSLVAGSFRSITGFVGRHNPRAYQVRTQTATIGIRGTDHEPMVIPAGAPGGEAGTYDKVNAGGTFIESTQGHGRVDVAPNRAGFAPLGDGRAPRLLAEVPRFYRPTRHEQRLLNRHQAAEKSSRGLRDERRRTSEERRKLLEKRKDGPKAEPQRDSDKGMKQRSEQREPSRQVRQQGDVKDRKDSPETRRKRVEQRREQHEERLERTGERRRTDAPVKAEARRREHREDAPRGRNRD